MNSEKKFSTKLQHVNTLQQGHAFDDGKEYTINQYKEMADAFYRNWVKDHHGQEEVSMETLAKDYWDMVETNRFGATVEYGNDQDTTKFGSGFPAMKRKEKGNKLKVAGIKEEPGTSVGDSGTMDLNDPQYYRHTTWNVNNISSAPGSLLRYLKAPINGINVPWLYVGMLFATFCWHIEDNYFYSINYSHTGAVKQWYAVPGEYANEFEKVCMLSVALLNFICSKLL